MKYFIILSLLFYALCNASIVKLPVDFTTFVYSGYFLAFIEAIYYAIKDKEHKSVTFILLFLVLMCAYGMVGCFGGLLLCLFSGLLFVLFIAFLASEKHLNNVKVYFLILIKSIKWSVFWFICFILSLLVNFILLIC